MITHHTYLFDVHGMKMVKRFCKLGIRASLIFYRIFFIYPRFELETQVESMLVYLSFDLYSLSFDYYIFALNSVFN